MSKIIFKDEFHKKQQAEASEEDFIKQFVEVAANMAEANGSTDYVCPDCHKVHKISVDEFSAGFFVSCFSDRDLVFGIGNVEDIVRAIVRWAGKDDQVMAMLMVKLMEMAASQGKAKEVRL